MGVVMRATTRTIKKRGGRTITVRLYPKRLSGNAIKEKRAVVGSSYHAETPAGVNEHWVEMVAYKDGSVLLDGGESSVYFYPEQTPHLRRFLSSTRSK